MLQRRPAAILTARAAHRPGDVPVAVAIAIAAAGPVVLELTALVPRPEPRAPGRLANREVGRGTRRGRLSFRARQLRANQRTMHRPFFRRAVRGVFVVELEVRTR